MAASCGADAVVIDLEDSVPLGEKGRARANLAEVRQVIGATADVLVRINSVPELRELDLQACADAGIPGVLAPKINDARAISELHAALAHIDYSPRLSILVESCAGVTRLVEILDAAGPLQTVALGVEDLRQELELAAPGSSADTPSLLWAHGALVVAAVAAGITPLGILGTLGELSDLNQLAANGRAAWQMGYRGSYCIHPKQVPILNAEYTPDLEDVAWAQRVTAAAAVHEPAGQGAFTVDGNMIDAPLIERAARILQLHETNGRRS